MSAQVIKRVRQLTAKEVLVGIPEGKNEREDGDVGNALIGYVMEHGDPERNIPARPWLVPGVMASLDQTTKLLKRAGEAAITGGDPLPGMTAAGLYAVESVQEYIRDVIPPPLAAATLAARKAAGHQGETPLVNTGKLLEAVNYVIADKGK